MNPPRMDGIPLALFGAPPAFAEPLHVGRPNIGDPERVLQRIRGALDRRWLTNDGPLVREFEAAVAARAGVAHCVAVANATVGLEILVRALGLTGEVVIPSWTFVATAHCLHWTGLEPAFADIDSATHNLDPTAVEAAITPRTSAILGVHLWGRPCDIDALAAIADRHGVALIFDAAHAFGCTRRGRTIGSFGKAEVFSFHATKFVNCGEGGAVVTDDGALAGKLRLMRNFGFSGYDRVVCAGTNGKMTEMAAAMGLTSLEAMDTFVEANQRNHVAYREALAGIPGISLLSYDEAERNNWQYVVVEVDEAQCGLRRDNLLAVLHAENVLARKYFWPGVHRMEPYRSLGRYSVNALTRSETVAARVIVLPTGPTLDGIAVDRLSSILRIAISQGPAIERQLTGDMASSTPPFGPRTQRL